MIRPGRPDWSGRHVHEPANSTCWSLWRRVVPRCRRATLLALNASQRRGELAGTTGHVAESVVEVVLDGFGWGVVWQFDGPGRYRVDREAAEEAKGVGCRNSRTPPWGPARVSQREGASR